jgi:hypothetical protein
LILKIWFDEMGIDDAGALAQKQNSQRKKRKKREIIHPIRGKFHAFSRAGCGTALRRCLKR